jgi:RNA polymerase-binding transcription factor
MTDATDRTRHRLLTDLASNAEQIAGLEVDLARMIAAAQTSNADDEHDPEGATIAFERQQVSALLDQAKSTRARLERAVVLLDDGEYGRCERCGAAIPAERLAARPGTTTCVVCAAAGTR